MTCRRFRGRPLLRELHVSIYNIEQQAMDARAAREARPFGKSPGLHRAPGALAPESGLHRCQDPASQGSGQRLTRYPVGSGAASMDHEAPFHSSARRAPVPELSA